MSQNLSQPMQKSLMIETAPDADSEYIILENIYGSGERSSPLRQRDLAHIAGASLGMTNSILKRLTQKGWISVKKLNSRNIRYAVTLEGINEIIRRSYRYFKRTIKNVVYYKEILEDAVNKAKLGNIQTAVLVGKSDLDFIVEYACERFGMSFIRLPEDKNTGEFPGALKIYAESIPMSANLAESFSPNILPEDTFYLSSLIIKQVV